VVGENETEGVAVGRWEIVGFMETEGFIEGDIVGLRVGLPGSGVGRCVGM
jgi:hypothetical protein